jgi:hypothetical protein
MAKPPQRGLLKRTKAVTQRRGGGCPPNVKAGLASPEARPEIRQERGSTWRLHERSAGPHPAGLPGRRSRWLARRTRPTNAASGADTPDLATPVRGRHQIGSGCFPGGEGSQARKKPTNGVARVAWVANGLHADSHDRTITVHGDAESPVITADRWPLDANDIPTPLDRTQEVAGSSPASSISSSPVNPAVFVLDSGH